MTIEYKYDCDLGGSFDIDPVDYEGMSASEIEHELISRARDVARRNCHSYVPDLDEFVAEIMAAKAEDDAA